MTSDVPPAAKGAMRVMGWFGKSCATELLRPAINARLASVMRISPSIWQNNVAIIAASKLICLS
jgi:hypothetical protein